MKYFMVTAKFGHVGRNNYFKGFLFLKANTGKEAARIARNCPRVKHGQKDAIIGVQEIDFLSFENGRKANHSIHYYTCKNIQEQKMYYFEIENNIFVEEHLLEEPKKYPKKHSLRKMYNIDHDYELIKNRKHSDYYFA